MTDACKLHSRPRSATCQRCGQFLCDWCVKLAPSWGAGYCGDCLHFVTPDTAQPGTMPLTTRLTLALLCVLAVFSFGGLRMALTHRPVDTGGVIWSTGIGVGLLLAVAFTLVQHWRKR